MRKFLKFKKTFLVLTVIFFGVLLTLNINIVHAADEGLLMPSKATFMGWLGDIVATGVSWIAVKITALFGKISLVLIEILINVAQYSKITKVPAVETGWVIIRDLCNMFFIIALLIIAFATILRQENYSIKRLLPKLLIMAVLINFSKTVFGIIVDFSQVVMLTFVVGFSQPALITSFFNIDTSLSLANKNEGGIPNSYENPTAGWALATAAMASTFTALAVLVMIAILTIILAIRIAMLWIYTILSPFVFLGIGFAPIKGYTNQIWTGFIKQVLIGPILAFFLWLAIAYGSASADTLKNQTAAADGIRSYLVETTYAVEKGESGLNTTGAASFEEFFLQNSILTAALIMCGFVVGMQAAEGAAAGIVNRGSSIVNGAPRMVRRFGANKATGAWKWRKGRLADRKKLIESGQPIPSTMLSRAGGYVDRRFLGGVIGKTTGTVSDFVKGKGIRELLEKRRAIKEARAGHYEAQGKAKQFEREAREARNNSNIEAARERASLENQSRLETRLEDNTEKRKTIDKELQQAKENIEKASPEVKEEFIKIKEEKEKELNKLNLDSESIESQLSKMKDSKQIANHRQKKIEYRKQAEELEAKAQKERDNAIMYYNRNQYKRHDNGTMYEVNADGNAVNKNGQELNFNDIEGYGNMNEKEKRKARMELIEKNGAFALDYNGKKIKDMKEGEHAGFSGARVKGARKRREKEKEEAEKIEIRSKQYKGISGNGLINEYEKATNIDDKKAIAMRMSKDKFSLLGLSHEQIAKIQTELNNPELANNFQENIIDKGFGDKLFNLKKDVGRKAYAGAVANGAIKYTHSSRAGNVGVLRAMYENSSTEEFENHVRRNSIGGAGDNMSKGLSELAKENDLLEKNGNINQVRKLTANITGDITKAMAGVDLSDEDNVKEAMGKLFKGMDSKGISKIKTDMFDEEVMSEKLGGVDKAKFFIAAMKEGIAKNVTNTKLESARRLGMDGDAQEKMEEIVGDQNKLKELDGQIKRTTIELEKLNRDISDAEDEFNDANTDKEKNKATRKLKVAKRAKDDKENELTEAKKRKETLSEKTNYTKNTSAPKQDTTTAETRRTGPNLPDSWDENSKTEKYEEKEWRESIKKDTEEDATDAFENLSATLKTMSKENKGLQKKMVKAIKEMVEATSLEGLQMARDKTGNPNLTPEQHTHNVVEERINRAEKDGGFSAKEKAIITRGMLKLSKSKGSTNMGLERAVVHAVNKLRKDKES